MMPPEELQPLEREASSILSSLTNIRSVADSLHFVSRIFNVIQFSIYFSCPFSSLNCRLKKKVNFLADFQFARATVYLRSLDQFYTVTYYIKWVKTSWTFSKTVGYKSKTSLFIVHI